MFIISLAIQNDTPLSYIGNEFMCRLGTHLLMSKKTKLKPIPLNYVKYISNCVVNCHAKLCKYWLNRSNLRAIYLFDIYKTKFVKTANRYELQRYVVHCEFKSRMVSAPTGPILIFIWTYHVTCTVCSVSK